MSGDLFQYPGHLMLYLGVGDAIVQAVNRSDDDPDFFRPMSNLAMPRWT